ncbi:MAG: DUF4412 domain-containing protein [Acidobacteria bacterium]|nr:DUF4412 domain-containing protein [Acidobacteriota bacterium]
MKKTILLAFLISCLALAGGASAGVYYEAKTTVDNGPGSMLVHAWIDGENARIEMIESDNPMMKDGTYMITRDAGKTLYLVNPKEETYSEWDLSAMMNLVEGMSGLVSMEFSEPEVEKLDEKDGGTIAGYSTRYYKYRTSYDMQMKILGMKRNMSSVSLQELWLSDDLDQPAMTVWLRKGARSGDGSLDRLIAAEMEKVKGFPLKTVTVSSSVGGKKGKETTSTTTMEVTTLRNESVDAKRFEIPSDYRRVDLLTGTESDEEGSNPLKGLFGKNR